MRRRRTVGSTAPTGSTRGYHPKPIRRRKASKPKTTRVTHDAPYVPCNTEYELPKWIDRMLSVYEFLLSGGIAKKDRQK